MSLAGIMNIDLDLHSNIVGNEAKMYDRCIFIQISRETKKKNVRLPNFLLWVILRTFILMLKTRDKENSFPSILIIVINLLNTEYLHYR